MQCENILFASRDVDPELKIADFGLAQLLQRGDKLMAGACKLNPKLETRNPKAQSVINLVLINTEISLPYTLNPEP
jgi:serine/threonine protein kinase